MLTWALAFAFGAWTLTDDGIYALVELLAEENIEGIDVDFVARTLGFSTLCGLTGAVLATLMRLKLGRAGALSLVFVISIIAKLSLILGTTQWLLVLGLCLWDFAFGALIPLVFGLAARAAIDGSVSVATNGVYVYGVALGPLFGTALFAMGGGTMVSIVMGAIGVITATVAVLVARVVERNVDKVPVPE